MKAVFEAPYPFFIGIEEKIAEDCQDLPADVIVVKLDSNKIMSKEELPKLPLHIYKQLFCALKSATQLTPKIDDPIKNAADQAFNIALISPEDNLEDEFDHFIIRDAFLECLSKILKDYEKCMVIYLSLTLLLDISRY